MNGDLPDLNAAKAAARRLRADALAKGNALSHGQALDAVARRHGFRDWNGLSAAIASAPPKAWAVGMPVRGRYLGHDFSGVVISATAVRSGWYRITLKLDEPLDVVTFDGFSNMRRRITGTIGPKGTSRERISNALPQLELAP